MPIPGTIAPPRYVSICIDIIERRRRTEINNNERCTVFLDTGNGVNDPVCTDFARILVTDIESRFMPGPTINGFLAHIFVTQLLQCSIIGGTTQEIMTPSI